MAVGDLEIPDGFGNAVFSISVAGRTNPVTFSIGYSPDSGIDPTAHASAIFNAAAGVTGICEDAGMMEEFTFNHVTCTFNDGGTFVGGASTAGAVTGTVSSGNPQIISSAVVVQKRTGLVGRHYKGRVFFPYMVNNEGNVDNMGNINSASMGALQTRWNQFYHLLSVATPVIIPNLLHHTPAIGTAPVPTPITSFLVTPKTGTQRRRLR